MSEHAADALLEAVDRVSAPVCVGLDPVVGRLPGALRPEECAGAESGGAAVEAIGAFTVGVLEAVAGSVPCVKFQSACYERYGHDGVRLLEEMIGEARGRGMEVIVDAKRGDIGISAEHYAAAVFGDGEGRESDRESFRGPAWITINTYLGEDGIRPFLRPRRGAFALVRTSNPGGDALQGRELKTGGTIADCVAEIVAAIGEDSIGKRGYSSLGAVVGATKPEDAGRLREIMPRQVFLVPGYGAQGGGVEDVLPCFDANGSGAIVTASRSVIYGFDEGSTDWVRDVREAAERFADEVGRAVGMR